MPTILCEKLFERKISWGPTLNPSWNTFKWVLFMNHRTLYVTVAQVGVAKLSRALLASSGQYDVT